MIIIDTQQLRHLLFVSMEDYMKHVGLDEESAIYMKCLKKLENMSTYEILKMNKNEEMFKLADFCIKGDINQIWNSNIWK